jgi:hypothetical protein
MNTWNSITKMKSQIALDGLDQKEGGILAKWEFIFWKINKLINKTF